MKRVNGRGPLTKGLTWEKKEGKAMLIEEVWEMSTDQGDDGPVEERKKPSTICIMKRKDLRKE